MTMKKILLLTLPALLALASCKKEPITGAEIEAYTYASLDQNGGTWVGILLDSSSQVGIPAPADISSPAYLDELADLKQASANLSEEEKEAVAYWGPNALVRWNEIARDLAAKYNLPPSPNEDGTYPAPDPANPGVYPYFPFAHPPYTCRMLAYWGAAQYDALIAAWHYKYAFNRPAPYLTDNSIEVHLPDNSLPSYPSDGAVVAAVSKEILTLMFPLEKDYIDAMATEHLNSLKWAGINTDSDIAAGDSLGRAVAALFIDRSKTDGMKFAQAPKEVSDSLRAAALAQFGWQWENQEGPPRPVGITPLFGQVKPWCLPNVEVVRPLPPPAPGSAEFQAAVAELEEISENLTEEQRAIANFWSDGLGTYTPPGHWNRLASEFMVEYRENPLRCARTFAYLNMAIMDAGISCWDAKYYYHYPRPTQIIPDFKAILGVPNFPSYTSGHSTFSAAAAMVLGHIYPAKAAQCDTWAEEAAQSRIYAGIHFSFDATVGLEQGRAVGSYSIAVAQVDGAE